MRWRSRALRNLLLHLTLFSPTFCDVLLFLDGTSPRLTTPHPPSLISTDEQRGGTSSSFDTASLNLSSTALRLSLGFLCVPSAASKPSAHSALSRPRSPPWTTRPSRRACPPTKARESASTLPWRQREGRGGSGGSWERRGPGEEGGGRGDAGGLEVWT